jgi:hypothetical protein
LGSFQFLNFQLANNRKLPISSSCRKLEIPSGKFPVPLNFQLAKQLEAS